MTKNILLGILLSILITIAGSYLYLEFGMKYGFEKNWELMLNSHNQGVILSIGAIPNLLLFFVFIKRKEDYKARGVMMGVILAAIAVFVFKFL